MPSPHPEEGALERNQRAAEVEDAWIRGGLGRRKLIHLIRVLNESVPEPPPSEHVRWELYADETWTGPRRKAELGLCRAGSYVWLI